MIRILAMLRLAPRLCLVVALTNVSAWAHASDTLAYNRDILPILAENCFHCHGPDKATRQSNLRLDNAAGATSSEGHPAAIIPGKLDESQLWIRVSSTDSEIQMPPPSSGKQLTNSQRETLGRWIEGGAKYEPHWSLVPLKNQSNLIDRDTAKVAASTAIDSLVLKAMPAELGGYNPPTDRSVLIRRLYLDLTGLPPDATTAQDFVSDARPDAVERTIDRLLASPRFGERWSRWWLDLAHYADSDGYLQDFLRPHAWRYRDWVLEAFNSDMPFDRFTIAQLAGDLLAGDEDSGEAEQLRIATGFLRQTLSNREGGADLEEYRVRQVVDRTVTVGTTWLGLTIGCAECHDHKYDPLTQVDFYRLYAYFNNCDEVNIDAPLTDERPGYLAAKERYLTARHELVAEKATEIERLQGAWEEKLLWTEQHPGADHRWDRLLEVLGLIWGQGNGEGQLEGLNIVKTPLSQRTPMQQARLQDYFLQHGSLIDPKAFVELKLEELSTKLSALATQLPKVSRPQTMVESLNNRQTHLHTRGDFRRPGKRVERGAPESLIGATGWQPRDRYELASWLVAPDNHLTSRVVVNRLWQEMLGRGIVATSENLGVRGSTPSHPELLDWLAAELHRQDDSLKAVLRQIALSDVYQQSSRAEPRKRDLDPSNVWLARASRVRLTAEGVRDCVLSSSGLMDYRSGGPSVRPPQPPSVASEGFDNKWEVSTGGDRYRRTLYTFWQRTSPFAHSINFDMPDSSRSCSRRERSNTPLQSLALLNDPVLVEGAIMAAYQVLQADDLAESETINQLFMRLLGREPLRNELQKLIELAQAEAERFSDIETARQLVSRRPENVVPLENISRWAAMSMVASVILNLDEAIHRP